MRNFAHLKPKSPWYRLFESGMVPIKNILAPAVGNMIGGGGVQEFYDVDLDKCTADQQEKIFEMLAAAHCVSVAEARKGIKEQGRLPLRAIHVSSVSTDSMAFLPAPDKKERRS